MERMCPFAGCGREIPATMFACYTHWFRLSAAQRERVMIAYLSWQKGLLSGDGLRAEQQAVMGEVEGKHKGE